MVEMDFFSRKPRLWHHCSFPWQDHPRRTAVPATNPGGPPPGNRDQNGPPLPLVVTPPTPCAFVTPFFFGCATLVCSPQVTRRPAAVSLQSFPLFYFHALVKYQVTHRCRPRYQETKGLSPSWFLWTKVLSPLVAFPSSLCLISLLSTHVLVLASAITPSLRGNAN